MIVIHIMMAVVTVLLGIDEAQGQQPDGLCINPTRLYPDVTNCRKFIRCVNRKPVTFSCPPRTTFDPETQICNWGSEMNECSQAQIDAEAKSLLNNKVVAVSKTTVTPRVIDTWTKQKQTPTTDIDIIDPILEAILAASQEIDETLDKVREDHSHNVESNISHAAAKSEKKFDHVHPINKEESESHVHSTKPSLAQKAVISNVPLDSTQSYKSLPSASTETTSSSILFQSKSPSRFQNEDKNPDFLNNNPPTSNTDEVGHGHEETETTINSILADDNDDDDRHIDLLPAWFANINNNNAADLYPTHDDDNVEQTSKINVLEVNKNLPQLSTINFNMATTSTTSNPTNTDDDETSYYTTLTPLQTLNLDLDSIASLNDSTADLEDQIQTDYHKKTHKTINMETKVDLHRLNHHNNVSTFNNGDHIRNNAEYDDDKDTVLSQISSGNNEDSNTSQRRSTPAQNVENLNPNSITISDDVHSKQTKDNQDDIHHNDNNIQIEQNTLNTNSSTSKYNIDTNYITTASSNDGVHPETTSIEINKVNINDMITLDSVQEDEMLSPNQDSGSVEKISNASSNPRTTQLSFKQEEGLKPVDNLRNLETIQEENNKKLVEMKSNLPSDVSSSQSIHIGHLSNFDLTTLPNKLPSMNSTTSSSHVEGVTENDDMTTPLTILTTSKSERRLNVSFKSVPYMVTGLVKPFRCPESDGHFLDPRNCSVYYHCQGGQAYRRDCPFGQVFHLTVLSCVSSDLAPPCPHEDELQEDDTTADQVYHCHNDGFFRHPKLCNVYYICASGNSMRMTCDPGTSFDLTHNLCMWNTEVNDCQDSKVVPQDHALKDSLAVKKVPKNKTKIETPKKESSLDQKDYKCPEKNGVFPDVNNCSIFYTCNGGLATRMVCPNGTGYDVMVAACVDSLYVKSCIMGRGFDDKLYDTVPNLQMAPFSCPEAHGLYPDPSNCSIFIHCFKKVPYRHTCQANTAFSSDIGVCTWRELVPGCQIAEMRQDIENTQSGLPQWGDEVALEPYKQHISYSESPESDSQGQSAGIQDFVCPDVADGFFRDNLFCDIFHRCVLHTRFTFTCPTGTFFRLQGHMCDFWETVTDCTQDGIRRDAMHSLPELEYLPVTPPEQSELDLSNSILDADPTPCPEPSGLFPHPRNCRQFLFCAHDVPLVLTCPESLLYNPQTLTCDLTKNVQCLRYDDYKKL